MAPNFHLLRIHPSLLLLSPAGSVLIQEYSICMQDVKKVLNKGLDSQKYVGT